MENSKLQILLADDDEDDCLFFKQALSELPVETSLTTVHDGEQLMQLLTNRPAALPAVLFLDLNMPRKNGFECLLEIKQVNTLRQLPIVILSTSFDEATADWLYKNGVHYCVRKPNEFAKLKQVIQQVLSLIVTTDFAQPVAESFVLEADL